MKKQPAKSKKRAKATTKKVVAKSSGKKTANLTNKKPFPVVAIGASAGGVEASSELLKHLAP